MQDIRKYLLLSSIIFALTACSSISPAEKSGEKEVNQVKLEEPVSSEKKASKAPSSYTHDQEFSVITVGTGNPIPNKNRASSCSMIQYKGKYYLVDTGNGSNNVMAANGYAFSDIRAIFFSHLHADHTTDFIDIMINRWMTGGKELEIIGPPRSGDLYKFMLDFFADDIIYRKYRGIKTGVTDLGMVTGVNVKEIIGENEFTLDGMKITTAEMTHTQYDLAYRFDIDGKSIVISGDTSFDEDLITLSKDADILIIDTSTREESEVNLEEDAFTDDSIEKPSPVYEYSGNFEVAPHMGVADVAKIAILANVKMVVITHLAPGPIAIENIRQQFKDAGYKGEVRKAEDGLEFNP
jgi:ribonuclease BN (tRNA processing enzyme)